MIDSSSDFIISVLLALLALFTQQSLLRRVRSRDDMERKVDFANQSFDVTVNHLSATQLSNARSNNSLNQLPQIITDKATGDLHDSKSTVTRLSDMTEAQDIRVQFFKSLAQLIGMWWFEVWWKWVAIGHGRGKKGKNGGDVLACSIQFPNKTAKVLDPRCPVLRRCGIAGKLVGRVGDEP